MSEQNKFDDDMNNDDNFEQEPNNKFSLKTILLLLFIVSLIVSAPLFFGKSGATKEEDITYSRLLDFTEKGLIDSVEEKSGYLYVRAKEVNKKFRIKMISYRLSDDVYLVNLLREKNIKISSIEADKTPFLLSILINWFPMLLLIGIWLFMLSRMNKGSGGGPTQIFSMGKTKTKNGEANIKVKFADVAGVIEAKAELEEVVQFLKEPEKFKNIGAKIPKGVLLLGAPGTGKTLLSKAVAGEAGVPFFSISGSEFVEMFVGVGASRVRDLFNKARKNSPCIVFIDEIDAVGRKRGSGHGGGNDEREQTLNQLLVEMDGFGSDQNIIVIAATNRPDVLDSALMRPGRFDRQVVVDRPDVKGREEILNVHSKGKKIGSDVDLKIIAKKTPGFVGADLANLFNEAAILAARAGRQEIKMKDLEEASEKVSMGPERKSRIMSDKEKKNTAYHEIGHALVAWLTPEADPVHKVTIIPRGMALGLTMQLPNEDKLSESRNSLLNMIKILLGGRVAEEIIFQDVTTGASNDIERATQIAYNMVTVYGMNNEIGPIRLGSVDDGSLMLSKNYGPDTARRIDEEVRKIIKNAYEEVTKMLTENIDMLHRASNLLLQKETITGKELDLLLKDDDEEILEALEQD